MKLAWHEKAKFFPANPSTPARTRGAVLMFLALAPLSYASAATLYIGGSPTTTLTAPGPYHFRPWVAGSAWASAKFTIKNMPAWARFNPDTGMLSGTAYSSNIGTYPNIIISASGGGASARLAPFTIQVTNGSTTTTSGPPTISGTPAASVLVGSAFSFTPTAADPAGRKLTFSVNTKPSWTSFNTATGQLSGTPAAANVGTTSNIVITASDGVASASLKAFSLTVTQVTNGTATLSWLPPTTDTSGKALTGLAGYQINYGTSSTNLSQVVQVANPGLTTYVINNLTPGTYYFGVLAYTSAGAQSSLSTLVSKTVN